MNYTSIEQSKRLVELGLNPNTADMEWLACHLAWDSTQWRVNCYPGIYTYQNPEVIPCWSVGALLRLMPAIKNSDKIYYPYVGLNRDNNFICVYKFNDNDWHWYITNDMIEACYDMVVWLLENHYLQ